MRTMRLTIAALALMGVSLAQTVRLPNVVAGTANSGASVKWNAASIPIGGHVAALAAGTVNLTAGTANSCAAPSFSSCQFVYATVSGSTATVATTETLGTAVTSSTVLLAFVETNSSGVPTQITYPWQSGTMFDAAGLLAGSTASAVTTLTPASAGGTAVGSAALPFSDVFVGTAATTNYDVQAGATPNAVNTIKLTDAGTNGALSFGDPTTPTKKIVFDLHNATAATALTVNDALAASRTVTFTDPGGAANVAYANPTTAQALSNTSLVQQSGTTSANGAYTAFQTFPMVLALATYTSVTDVAGQQWFSEIYVPSSFTATGACQLNGSSVGTDLAIVALWNSAGTLLANSNLSGTLVTGNSVYQCQAFLTPVALVGPQRYFVGIQGNATHATEFTTYVTGSAPTGYAVGITAPGSFGTITNITPTSTFTTAEGPIMVLY